MPHSVIHLFVLAILVADISAQGGVKGGHRHRYPTNPNQEINRPGDLHNNSHNAVCYKTVPYSYALSLNATGSIQYDTVSSPDDNSGGWVRILDCCDGYIRNVSTGKCVAHCDEGCYGGVCTSPNVCTCEPGWQVQGGFCTPTCDQPCQRNAYCFAPNVCTCKLGYEEINGECKPICPDGCLHGECVAPRVCRCRPGFVLNEQQHTCTPVCEGGCQNGQCTAPGVCTCNNGYHHPPGETESCVPECVGGCIGGTCVRPHVCQCPEGLHLDRSGRCLPHQPTPDTYPYCRCGPHGACVGSNRCICHPGYMVEPDTGACAPITDATSTSTPWPSPDNHQNQYCRCGPHGVCIGPNRCICENGYAMDPDTGRCVPSRSTSGEPTPWPTTDNNQNSRCRCGPHGTCVGGPRRCICEPGYLFDPDTGLCLQSISTSSEPTARPPIYNQNYECNCGPHGRCSGPKRCVCDYGYTVDSITGECVNASSSGSNTQCIYGCGNGDCIGPNQCSCYPGYRVDPNSMRCVLGNPEMPCKRGCGMHSICARPDRCVCAAGYTNDPITDACVESDYVSQHQYPSCERPCLNGECTGHNQCTCRRGYIHDPTDPTRTRCVPYCPGGCVNGVCTAPNYCICNLGYVKDTSVKSRQRCVPA